MRAGQVIWLLYSNFLYDYYQERCTKLVLCELYLVVHVNVFHDYILFSSDYFLAVPISKIFLALVVSDTLVIS